MNNFEKFYNSSLRFLSYRPRSEKEVRDYLMRHSGKERKRRLQNLLATERNARDSGHGQNDDRESIIERVISKLKEQKFLNDEEFAKWWIGSRLRFKPRSLRLIKIELRQKGISQEVIEEVINDSRLTNSDLEQAKKLVEKRITRFRNPSASLRASKFGMTREKIYQKLGRYLASKGFDWDTIKQSIDELLFK